MSDKFEIRTRKFLNKTFNEFRDDMISYIRTYYPDKIQDFSENSVLGSLIDISAFVGDNLSFYLDHQISELDPETCIEEINLESHIRNSGIKITGASPSVAELTIEVEIPVDIINNKPSEDSLPIIKTNTIFTTKKGINFRLLENIDFSEKKESGDYNCVVLPITGQNNNIISYIFKKSAVVISGDITTETFNLGDFIPFRKITLTNSNITEIISVIDSFNNNYYEVNDLGDDVVYLTMQSLNSKNQLIKDSIKLINAPFRYTTEVNVNDRLTTLTLGGGAASTSEYDVVPDPSQYAINLYGKKIIKDFSLNPTKLLNTKTLGVCSENCLLTVTYRFGGGLSHNVPANEITEILIKDIDFHGNADLQTKRRVLKSITVYNQNESTGGTNPTTINELRGLIKSSKNSQSRIVTKEDLLARIYTMPSNFGKVFRAAVKDNIKNPLATQLFIVSKNADNHLTISQDTLKINLKNYLNRNKLITDSIDILDANIINLNLKFQIIKDINYDKSTVLKNVLTKLKNYFSVDNFYIEQPIIISEIITLIMSVDGVVALEQFDDKSIIKFDYMTGQLGDRIYNNTTFNIEESTKMGLLIPPVGGIFEFKYPDYDFIGKIT